MHLFPRGSEIEKKRKGLEISSFEIHFSDPNAFTDYGDLKCLIRNIRSGVDLHVLYGMVLHTESYDHNLSIEM